MTTSGILSQASQQNALDTLNFARYIAGLSYDVSLSDSYSQNAQDGAFALALLNNGLSHGFAQPDWMSDSLYASANLGTAQSNLSGGISNLATNVIHGWLSDEGDNNAYALGHRRWILAPSLTETGFGLVYNSQSTYKYYSAMNIQDADTSGDQVGVVWPAQTMPVEYFGDDYPWSYTASTLVVASASSPTTVTITRAGDGESWTMVDDFFWGSSGDGFIAVNNDSYGQPGCIIFKPEGISYRAGDVYQVEISGPVTASYTVTFFSLDQDYTPQTEAVTPEDTTAEEPSQEPDSTATDLSGASTWAQAELTQALEEGYPVAVYNQLFTQEMTRGQFAHMLGLFCDNQWPMAEDYSSSFTDLGNDPADTERNYYIAALNNWGIIDGMDESTFAPDATITREAIAKLLLGVKSMTLNIEITQDISSYSDASSVSDWALDGVRYMNQIGVLNGTDENLLNPHGNVTVQEAALMCYRLFQR